MKEEKQLFRSLVLENIECLAIAVIMALILKFYLIEAYKIPTGSMQPTIIGNEERGLFDRVLVNKFIYLFNDPERWDVIVFKYPLDQSKNYIKRLVGLPGEKVTIRKGDIYINGAIERKPENAIGAVLKKIFPKENGKDGFADFFEAKGKYKIRHDDGIVFFGPGSAATRRPIETNYFDGYDPDYRIPRPGIYINESPRTSDLRIAFSVRPLDAGTGIFARITGEGRGHLFRLAVKGQRNGSFMATGLKKEKKVKGLETVWDGGGVFLEKGRSYEVVFSHIDDRLSIRLDGNEIASYTYEDPGRLQNWLDNGIEFGSEGGGAEFSGIAIYRDIYYLAGRDASEPVEFDVPPGHYFALGDNTQNSADSRLWQSAVFTLTDGREIRGSYDPMPRARSHMEANPARLDGGGFYITNNFGDRIFIDLSELGRKDFEKKRESFIPEKLMLGKAMVVFWPIYPHFRWKLLR